MIQAFTLHKGGVVVAKSVTQLTKNRPVDSCISLGFPIFVVWRKAISMAVIFSKLKGKLATVIEGDRKAPFSIATTSRCREGRCTFPRIAPLYLDTYLILLSVKQGGIKYHF